MELLLSDPYTYLDAALLIFVRIVSFLIILPFLGSNNIPNIAKIGLSFFITMIMVNVAPIDAVASSTQPVVFAIAVAKEFFIGWMLGFAVYLAFSILTLAGQFIDYQIGFSMVNVFDPLSQIQFTVTGNLYYFLLLLVVITSRSHYLFIDALKKSYQLIPLGGAVLNPILYDAFLEFLITFFIIALQIAAPFFFVMLIVNAVLGILARTTPQLNMFVIGFPIKILLGMFVLYLTIYMFDGVSDKVIHETMDLLDSFLKGMMP